MVEFDLVTTGALFVALTAIGVAGLWFSPTPMGGDTILTMVLPSMLVFGLICLLIGVKHGEHRTRAA